MGAAGQDRKSQADVTMGMVKPALSELDAGGCGSLLVALVRRGSKRFACSPRAGPGHAFSPASDKA